MAEILESIQPPTLEESLDRVRDLCAEFRQTIFPDTDAIDAAYRTICEANEAALLLSISDSPGMGIAALKDFMVERCGITADIFSVSLVNLLYYGKANMDEARCLSPASPSAAA